MEHRAEERIERIVHDIVPETAFEGKVGRAQTLPGRMAACHTPGVSIAVVDGFEVAWARGWGVRQAGTGEPVTPETLFQAASISKPVFALAVVRLVQDGVLDLDCDVNEYLTSWHVPANDSWQPRVTLRQLLSHSAGTTVTGFPGYTTAEALPTLAQVLDGEPPANTAPIEVNSLPGLQCSYSGGGTTIAQQVVIDRLGRPLPEIMREHVLRPLGLAGSTFEQPLPQALTVRASAAHPYKGVPIPGRYHVYPEMAAAGLWTTPTDLAQVGLEVLRALDGRSSAILTRETAQAMLAPQAPDSGAGYRPALGFFLRGEGDERRFYHSGWNEGFVAHAQFYPDSGQGAVVMLNSNEGNDLMFEIVRAIGREYGWPDLARKEKPAPPAIQADRYCGVYTAEDGTSFRVSTRDGMVHLEAGCQPPLPLVPRTVLEFAATAVNASVSFEEDVAGSIVRLTLGLSERTIAARRSG